MNSKQALMILENMAQAGEVERLTSPSRESKAIVFATRNGRHFALEIGDGQKDEFATKTKVVLEFNPGGRAIDWSALEKDSAIELNDKQWGSSAYKVKLAERLQAGMQKSAFVATERALRDLIAWYGEAGAGLDKAALQRLKQIFMAKHPDFVSFDNSPSFATAERDYKHAVVSEAGRLLSVMADESDEALGAALIELLAGRAGVPCNLIDWRAQKVIDDARAAQPSLVERATGRLARAEDGTEAIITYLAEVWPAMSSQLPSKPYAESRMFPTMLRALVAPDEVLPIRSSPTNNVMRYLMGGAGFAGAPLSRDELSRVNAMAEEIKRVMDEEWGWAPRDLWDVQGFIWVTCRGRLDNAVGADPVTVWMVTSLWGQTNGLARFVERGEWSLLTDVGNANNRRVREMQVGDRIFLKDYLPRARDFPFTADGEFVTAHRFTAEGTITEASEDGMRVGVDWHAWDTPRTWYFYTNNDAVWRLLDQGKDECADRLRRFLLKGEAQDHQWFLDNGWRKRTSEAPIANVTEGKEMSMQSTNLILYGPPGTGKTYRTALEAVRLCGEDVPEDRDELMQRYEDLSKEGRIRFVTFHQSFSYEEFVEGLRPETASGDDQEGTTGGFRLDPVPGIFRELCAVAEEARRRPQVNSNALDFSGRKFWKMSLGRVGQQDSVYDRAIEDGHISLGYGGDIDWSDDRFETLDAIRKHWQSAPREDDRPSNYRQLHPFRNELKVGDIVIVPASNRTFRAIGEVIGDYYYEPDGEPTYYHRRRVRWLAILEEPLPLDTIIEGDFMMRSFYPIPVRRVNHDALSRLVQPSAGAVEASGQPSQVQQFVMIIDEINRANVSKVFGELITLIEPDKRLGMTNALKVRLPYSKREFGVPANLHIIGTMNTADRSIALLDTALRRRFRFEEMEPDTSVPAFVEAERNTGLPLAKVLDTMNRRIEYLVDRDHRIGHAFFIGCRTRWDVDAVMRDKVIPLLQEYFFDDWNRLAAVLGEKDKGGNFLDCEKIPDPMAEGRDALNSWRVRRNFDESVYDRLISATPPPLADEGLIA